ncbi:hypothetical protein GCM10008955_37230 [Deinococcus malanensis]|uniref:DUF1795 domain-containing protein n=1 Tax=Deinococcus malanensis TaxID=1706855 RepID=A0ABQ2F4F8_9DEIO|nr:PsbP-related protein [Deinococcus malanensis]GGK39997.1 hypothetical protein GCM10008955_37230 [Deinococcus malanensis]
MFKKTQMAVLALLVIVGGAQAKTFRHATNGYSLTYPDAWTAKANLAGTDVAISVPGTPGATSMITVVTQKLPQGMNLAAYTQATTESLPQMLGNYKLDTNKTVKVGGVAGRKLVFTGTRGGNTMYGNIVLLVRGDVGYTLSYLGELPANAAAKETIDRVLTSFKLTK